MRDNVVTILILIAAALTITLGYTVAKLMNLRDQVEVQQHALEALSDPAEPTEEKRRRKLPEGWKIYTGGLGALVGVIIAVGAANRRRLAAALAAAGTASVLSVALLGHVAPSHHGVIGRRPYPSRTVGTARTTALPSTAKPSPSDRRTPVAAIPLPPVRGRRSVAPPLLAEGATSPEPSGGAPVPTVVASLGASLIPSASPSLPSASLAAPAKCPIGLTLRVLKTGVTACV